VDIPKILIQALEIFNNDYDIITKVFRTINLLILIDEDLDLMETDDRVKIFRQKFIEYDIEKFIRTHVNSDNDELYQIASLLEEEFNS
jgi:hypothetical protein